jgi:hypothetical protein
MATGRAARKRHNKQAEVLQELFGRDKRAFRRAWEKRLDSWMHDIAEAGCHERAFAIVDAAVALLIRVAPTDVHAQAATYDLLAHHAIDHLAGQLGQPHLRPKAFGSLLDRLGRPRGGPAAEV